CTLLLLLRASARGEGCAEGVERLLDCGQARLDCGECCHDAVLGKVTVFGFECEPRDRMPKNDIELTERERFRQIVLRACTDGVETYSTAIPSDAAQSGEHARTKEMTDRSRPSVLLVEDEPELRALIAEGLEIDGFTVAQALDGADAVDRLRGYAYDALIV